MSYNEESDDVQEGEWWLAKLEVEPPRLDVVKSRVHPYIGAARASSRPFVLAMAALPRLDVH